MRAIHQRIQNKKTLRFSELVDERTPVPVVVVTFLLCSSCTSAPW